MLYFFSEKIFLLFNTRFNFAPISPHLKPGTYIIILVYTPQYDMDFNNQLYIFGKKNTYFLDCFLAMHCHDVRQFGNKGGKPTQFYEKIHIPHFFLWLVQKISLFEYLGHAVFFFTITFKKSSCYGSLPLIGKKSMKDTMFYCIR